MKAGLWLFLTVLYQITQNSCLCQLSVGSDSTSTQFVEELQSFLQILSAQAWCNKLRNGSNFEQSSTYYVLNSLLLKSSHSPAFVDNKVKLNYCAKVAELWHNCSNLNCHLPFMAIMLKKTDFISSAMQAKRELGKSQWRISTLP